MQFSRQPGMSIRSPRPVTAASRPAAPVMRSLSQPPATASRSKALRLQLEQMRLRCQQLEQRIKQAPAVSYRQTLQTQLQKLEPQLSQLQMSLLQAQSQERLPALKALHEDILRHPDPAQGADYQNRWQTIYPPELQVYAQPEQNKMFHHWQQQIGQVLHASAAKPAHLPLLSADLLIHPLPLQEEELALWQALQTVIKCFLPELPPPVLPTAARPQELPEAPSPAPEMQLLELEPETPSRQQTAVQQAQAQGLTLEVQFEAGKSRPTVRNQMGIVINQQKKSYQEYLTQGFTSIDRSAASHFQDSEPLKTAIHCFLEAISLDPQRHEAFFGLGYLYALVRDVDHALYFLEIAHKRSGHPSIQALIMRVKSSAGVA